MKTTARNRRNGKGAKSDLCFTPAYALQPILDLLPSGVKVWEPAAGQQAPGE